MHKAKISITFDDGNDNTYTNAYPIMRKYGLIGTVFVYTYALGTNGKMTYAQLAELQAYGFEVGSHTANNKTMTTLTESEARAELVDSKQALEQNGLNVKSFAPPSRLWNNSLATLAEQEGYKAVRAVSNSNAITQSYQIPNLLYVNNGTPSMSTLNINFDTVKGWINKAINEGAWINLLFHHVADSLDSYTTSLSEFEAICSYVKFRKNKGDITDDTFYNSLFPTKNILNLELANRVLMSDRSLTADRILPAE